MDQFLFLFFLGLLLVYRALEPHNTASQILGLLIVLLEVILNAEQMSTRP
jgi:hypothetical protein